MRAAEQRQVAQAFGVSPGVVPLLPELLAGIEVLGSWPEAILGLLRDAAGLAAPARVLDLGCGKGPVAVVLARQLGLRVDGVDLFPPFLEEARAAAAAAGVAELCRFEIGDLRGAARRRRGYDAVVLAGLGAGLFGGFAGCVEALRACVRDDGWMVVDDGFLAHPGAAREPGYEYYRGRRETLYELTAHGDRLAGEVVIEAAELERVNRRNTALIAARIGRLAAVRPELAGELGDYLRSEEAECEFLESRTRPAVWLLQRRLPGRPGSG